MTIESATYIDELVASYPSSGDFVYEGDDHLRLLKNVLLASFPNIGAEMSATTAELNSLAGAQAFILSLLTSANENAAHAALDTETLITSEKRTFTAPQGISSVNLGNVSGAVNLDLDLYTRFRLRLTGTVTLSFIGTPQPGNIEVVVEWAGDGYSCFVPFNVGAIGTQNFSRLNGYVVIMVADYDDSDGTWRYAATEYTT